MAFRVGQKVVCVGRFISPVWHRCEAQPARGSIYTVRGFAPPEYFNDPNEEPVIYLVELINKPVRWSTGVWELGWDPNRFRPIVEKKTDISIFTEILHKTTKRQDA